MNLCVPLEVVLPTPQNSHRHSYPTLLQSFPGMSTLLVGVVGKWTWSLNDILVFSSLVAFVFIVLACSLMWTTRPVIKKESPEQRAERRRSSWAPIQPENVVDSNKSKGSNSSKTKEKKKLGKKERLKDLERGTSELSNSFEGESLLGEQLGYFL